ncbi:hypothetical protein LNO23_11940 [Klebsiella pneumoniae subsp. pneumoniae]|nr:hypothetical protein [Klebsiella pneumoniae subsp. pneumoniae]
MLTMCAIEAANELVIFPARNITISTVGGTIIRRKNENQPGADDEYLASCTKNRCFALTITCAFAKTFKEEEKQYLACGEFSCTQMPFLSGLTKSTHGVDRRHA